MRGIFTLEHYYIMYIPVINRVFGGSILTQG